MGCRRSRSAAPGRPARGGSAAPRPSHSPGPVPCPALPAWRWRLHRAPDGGISGLRLRRSTAPGPSHREW
ncbi:hypothetical protein G6F40_016959 [Rhizopus arrhizus]|nr:hypothetical protein G6F40_016959 [Rhizopus arrhizus]